MRLTRYIFGVLVLLALPVVSTCAQSATDCASLMKFGIYDRYRTFTTETQYKQIREFFSNFQFSTQQQAQNKAAELGLDITGVLGLTFNGTTSSSNFQQWQQSLVRSSYQEALSFGLQVQSIEKISNALTDLVGRCLTQKGVHAYIIPAADNQTFSVTIDFVPYSSERPLTHGLLTMTPSSVAASCAPAGVLNQRVEIGPQGVSLSCRRSPTETVAVNVNTDDGSPAINYDAYIVPPPNINFRLASESIQSGQSTTLNWEVANASRVEIEGYGPVSVSGSLTITPTQTRQYRLIVTSLDGQQTSTYKTVTVLPPPPVLTGARVFFHTTNDDKDGDTNVSVYVIYGGETKK
ncbi:MAG: hypothetical protein AUG51_11445 [Acidobacteria bacterium 13_1_20CM_3_53_8]|nr:MAG: hypothetical protein AUG51_11445 [Acidobacteria bacterium 13_1_20CM_3_53_8]